MGRITTDDALLVLKVVFGILAAWLAIFVGLLWLWFNVLPMVTCVVCLWAYVPEASQWMLAASIFAFILVPAAKKVFLRT